MSAWLLDSELSTYFTLRAFCIALCLYEQTQIVVVNTACKIGN